MQEDFFSGRVGERYWGPKSSTKNKASDVTTEFVTGCNANNANAFISGAENYTY